ncbi:P-loop NTPase fold protein [Paenibacillus xylanexedens]
MAKDQKNIFLIDELGHCRPTYANKTLETIKHLFSI